MPPPIPSSARPSESPLATYLKAALIILPAFLFLLFEFIFIFPRAEQLWNEAGLQDSHAQGLFHATAAILDSARIIVVALLAAFCLLELFCPPWPRWRAWTVAILAALFNIFVLTTLAMTSIVAALAGPVLVHKAELRASPKAPPTPAP